MTHRHRPMSTESRTAWTEGGFSNPSNDDDYVPAAMEHEYTKPKPAGYGYGKGPEPAATAGPLPQKPTSNQSGGGDCWDIFMRGVRAIWQTKQTEIDKAKDNKEFAVKTTLRELVIYLFFLADLCIISFATMSSTMYFFSSVMTNLFTGGQWDNSNPGANFMGIGQPADWFSFALGVLPGNETAPSGSPLLGGLYWEQWYNGYNMTPEDFGYVSYENKLMGLPRIRQVRVRNDSCKIQSYFKEQIIGCYSAYSSGAESKDPFGKMNGSAWVYRKASELDTDSYWGQVDSYGGGGFAVDLGLTSEESTPILYDLYNNLWIDRATRAVFVDFTVYNANINLFCVVKLVVEFPATGGAIPSYSIRSVKLLRYVSGMDFFVLACEGILCLFLIYYIVEEILEIKQIKLAYLKEFWNLLDIIVLLIVICCIGFNVYRTLSVNSLLDKLMLNPDAYYDFDTISYWQENFNAALAFMVFCSWIKLFKYISFNKTMTQLTDTLGACAKDLLGFAIMFFIVFLSFAQLGYMCFGSQATDFSSFVTAIFTLFRIILGDFNFQELQQANRVIGPAYFILYVFFVFFVLLNMFLAIINDTYSEVKAELADKENEFEMGDFFKTRTLKLLTKLNLKREKIVSIQEALNTADTDGDQQIDFEEWRHNLKMRGYAEAEIEAVFAKYDTNGDRILDQKELAAMAADLEHQNVQLGKEYNEAAVVASSVDDDDFVGGGGGGVGGDGPRRLNAQAVNAAPLEEFVLLQRRVDRMEHSIGSIVLKIDSVLGKLEQMEISKARRRETMSKMLDNISESQGTSDEEKRRQMENMMREELERWDAESTYNGRTPTPSARGERTSPPL